MDYLYGWQVSVVVKGGHDWFQVSESAVGIPGVAGSDAGHDTILQYPWHWANQEHEMWNPSHQKGGGGAAHTVGNKVSNQYYA